MYGANFGKCFWQLATLLNSFHNIFSPKVVKAEWIGDNTSLRGQGGKRAEGEEKE